ncbi:3-hydroxyacyl-CoA dehydrogenase NAD-binding domain-containing protein [Microbulbifer pacificus]|uniref:3-hydroxyacyl-CoA dehydrogenase NAD-binding domain-containing protein n=1 Tax=Microbulbifer pacificus TaxID=407164 RepID=A0AAU0N1D5_9GAMM|nr:3-hydroxyacyl-CoA dehydrogenase NAD-binding domain-containing protein [Microbulbifer pacificus]WOX05449.1 3-hydroxyacyl-CoA dehydrogenase NAD-binding domain-containing protein [Microbulbifer pacificus]
MMSSINRGLKVAIVGAGTMGRGIVQVLAQTEDVTSIIWKGRSLKSIHSAFSDLEVQLGRLVAKKRIAAEEASRFIRKIVATEDYADLTDAQCIIEAVSENMDAKRDVFVSLAKVTSPDTILASNTSSLSITELASLTANPANVVGLHFFNPAPVMKLTEVIAGLTTSQCTLNWALDFARKLGKDPVVVNEAPGFIVNRMLIPMINEAIGILAESVATAEEIDKAMTLGANHPIGPLALADLIGNDVNLSIMETLHSETGDPKYRAHPLLRKMVRANLLGRKTGFGFFKY